MKIQKSSHEIESTAYLLKSITGGWKTIYVSVPMTTGPRFLDWFCNRRSSADLTSDEYRKEHYDQVIDPNCKSARKYLSRIRRDHPNTIIIDPTSFSRSGWTQEEYHYFWGKIIECCVNKVIFLDGWQYSAGCSYEFLTAVRNGIETTTQDGQPLSRELGCSLIEKAIKELKQLALPTAYLERVIREMGLPVPKKTGIVDFEHKLLIDSSISLIENPYFKDEVLDHLADERNVAQFISFSPALKQRFARIIGFKPNKKFSSARLSIDELISKADDGSVNVRTFRPDKPKGGQFFYGLNNSDDVMSILSTQSHKGLYTIVNETIDVEDGGVSGVSLGNIIEFAPHGTPKCVDAPGVCSLPRQIALQLLETVYGFRPALNFDLKTRVEFSIHPQKRGLHKEHTIIWEVEEINQVNTKAFSLWPNKFSQMIGDKSFGLLIAEAIGLPTPRATVLCRSIAPFTFGRATEKWNTWMRTCPKVRTPGKYPTIYGWSDPFALMNSSDGNLASLLVQEAVYPEYSGSLISVKNGTPLIEGLKGRGDSFMMGQSKPEKLPQEVISAAKKQHKKAYDILGPVEMEWVYDGLTLWIVQLHRQLDQISIGANVIYPGNPRSFRTFNTNQGLEALRDLVAEIKNSSVGIILVGDIGLTSHFGDILRTSRIPSKIERGPKSKS